MSPRRAASSRARAQICHRLAVRLAHDGDGELLAERLELVDRRRTVDVRRGQQRVLALPLEVTRELGRRGGLARALQAHQHDDRGRMGRHGEPVPGAAEQVDQLVAHHLDHVLPRRQRLENVLADGLLADAVDEPLDDLEVDVGLEEGEAHLAEGLDDILLRQPAVSAEPVENTREATSQAVEHGSANMRGYEVGG